MKHVFSYTIINDVSARDYQMQTSQWTMGKTFDTFAPMGPWIVTKDEVANPQSLNLRLTVNGVVKQESSTANMIHPVDEIISWISYGMTLLPGMMVATGTPEGVGFARTPPEFIRVGDIVEAEVEDIGKLRNKFVATKNPRRID